MFFRSGSDIFGTIIFILILFLIGFFIFLYFGFYVLLIALAIGLGIAAIYAIVVYIRAMISAGRDMSGMGVHSITELLKNWVRFIYLASGYAFKENLTVASNALSKSHIYRLISPRRWMWFIVAPASIIFGTLVILAVLVLQVLLFLALVWVVLALLFLYIFIAFVFACGYACFYSVKNTANEDVKGIFTFNFTLSARLGDFGSASKQYFVGLFSVLTAVWRENLSIGQSNKSYASSYKIIQPQYVFLLSSFVALPLIASIYYVLVTVVAFVCFIPIAIVCFFWTLIAMLISKIRGY